MIPTRIKNWFRPTEDIAIKVGETLLVNEDNVGVVVPNNLAEFLLKKEPLDIEADLAALASTPSDDMRRPKLLNKSGTATPAGLIMVALRDSGSGVTNDVLATAGLSESHSSTVSRLTACGYLERVRFGRSYLIDLSPAGRQRLKEETI